MRKAVRENVGKQFYVTVDITASVTVPVIADNLDEALAKAKEFTVMDIIQIDDEAGIVDDAIEVSGVYR